MNLGQSLSQNVDDPKVRAALLDYQARINRGWNTQHNTDGTHATIAATGTISERRRAVPMGNWTAMPFNASNFTSDNGTTVTVASSNVTTARYMQLGATVWFMVEISGFTIGAGSPTYVYMALPNGWQVASQSRTAIQVVDNSTNVAGIALAQTGTTSNKVKFGRIDGSTWAASAGASSIFGTFAFELAGQ